MARTAELIHILRRTLIELEESEHPDTETVRDLKRSIRRSIAEMETWQDNNGKEPSSGEQTETSI